MAASEPERVPYPFGLNESSLKEVEILYGFYSAKTGAGKQEIRIRGDGSVELFFTRTYESEPIIRRGRLPSETVTRLLDFTEDQGLMGLQDHYPPSGDPHYRRVLQLTLPGRTKRVMLDEPGSLEFERISAAVQFTAGMALPEALRQRFFPNL